MNRQQFLSNLRSIHETPAPTSGEDTHRRGKIAELVDKWAADGFPGAPKPKPAHPVLCCSKCGAAPFLGRTHRGTEHVNCGGTFAEYA